MIKKSFILTLGSATCDLFIDASTVKQQEKTIKKQVCVEEGTKVEVMSVDRMAGGGALNAARTLAKLGFLVKAFCKIAQDDAGRVITDEMTALGVDLSSAITNAPTPTATSFILRAESGNHPILAYRGANETIEEKDLPWQLLETAAGLYIAPLGGAAADLLPRIAHYGFDRDLLVLHNPNEYQLTHKIEPLVEALRFISFLVLNAREARLLFKYFLMHTDIEHPKPGSKQQLPHELFNELLLFDGHRFSFEDFAKIVLDYGVQTVVVTNGAEGVYAATKAAQNSGDEGDLFFCPSKKVSVYNTVGAGDTFGSTLFGALFSGCPLEKALACATLNSAALLESKVLPPHLLTMGELEAQLEKMDGTAFRSAWN